MLKRFLLALAGLISLASPTLAAGTINLALTQQFDSRGVPLGGCKLYTFQTGTTNPQSAYKDVGLTIAQTNPVECDSSGRLPAMFFADGTIKLRLTDRSGVVLVTADSVPVLGSSAGGAGGTSVDASTVLATGDVKYRYGTGTLAGFVRANGRTIGSVASGASERANADAQPLFEYLWNNDPNLAVSGGRGANSTADFVANKTITLPDFRGRVLAGMDDMGTTSAARISATVQATTLGGTGGVAVNTLAVSNLPVFTPSGSIAFSSSGTSSHTPSGSIAFSATGTNTITPTGSVSFASSGTSSHTPTGSITVGGSIAGNGTNLTVAVTDPGHTHGNTVASLTGLNSTGTAGFTTSGTFGTSANSISNVAAFTGITAAINANTIASSLTWNVGTHTFTGNADTASFSGISQTASFGGTTDTATFTGTPIGNGGSFNITQPTMVVTLYIKL